MGGAGVGNDKLALNDLIDAINHDRCSGKLLLQPGRCLVAFIPCPKDSNVLDLVPSEQLLSYAYAGLELLEKREQKLHDYSRWVVSFLSLPSPNKLINQMKKRRLQEAGLNNSREG